MTLTLSLRPDVTVVATIVPEGSFDHGFRFDCFSCVLPDSKPGTYHWLTEAEEYMRKHGGQYEIVGLLREIPEEQAAGLVEYSEMADRDDEHLGGYLDYKKGTWGFSKATDALKSAIKANNGDPELNWFLLKKIQ